MNETLDETKTRISRKYLGKAGIHGVSIRRSQNALCVYLDANFAHDQETILEEIEKEAAPYKVLKIEEERPTIN